jgi:GTP-binding protein EngB required for normal cell division
MRAELEEQRTVAADIVGKFGLTSLYPALRACEALAENEAIDVAVLGQFKSGKSSLLNAVLGETLCPVGVVPVTAVITRVIAGQEKVVRVTHLDGVVEEVAPDRLAEFVTESGNPGNKRRATVVDVYIPALRDWPGVRLVDTPGLGSVFAHNTEATRAWMPNVAVALVTVSAERPLSDEDRRLVAEARQTAPRVVVVLTKVDLLADHELKEVTDFLNCALCESFGAAIPVLPFSVRVEPGRWVHRLRESVLGPVAADVAGERRTALALKTAALAGACRDYLSVGLRAAERIDAERDELRAAVFTEAVNTAVIRDELRLTEEQVRAETRPAFTDRFLARRAGVMRRMTERLAAELQSWRGDLAKQARRYEAWMAERLVAELAPLSCEAAPLAADLLGRAEGSFRRIVEAVRDRLSRNIHEATGVSIAPVAWEVHRPELTVVPVALSQTFMTHWDLLWWLLPMSLVGGLFRRHVLGRVSWEVEKNLIRLAGDWATVVDAAVADLRTRACVWVDTELATLDRLLGRQPAEATTFRDALRRLEEADDPLGRSGNGRSHGPTGRT